MSQQFPFAPSLHCQDLAAADYGCAGMGRYRDPVGNYCAYYVPAVSLFSSLLSGNATDHTTRLDLSLPYAAGILYTLLHRAHAKCSR